MNTDTAMNLDAFYLKTQNTMPAYPIFKLAQRNAKVRLDAILYLGTSLQ